MSPNDEPAANAPAADAPTGPSPEDTPADLLGPPTTAVTGDSDAELSAVEETVKGLQHDRNASGS